ncbi:hypothetical protein HWV62_43593 [Athelia sp. TMB]|nr:hypothetical protein HWV62_43593 [Athelia sp. TMB]
MIAYIPFLAALAASVSAAPTIGSRSCASGYTSGSTTTSVTFAVPMTTLEPIVKSFFNAAWEGINVTSTTGTDDAIGATRSFLSAGILPMTEQLIIFKDVTPYVIERVWAGVGGASQSDHLPITASSVKYVKTKCATVFPPH